MAKTLPVRSPLHAFGEAFQALAPAVILAEEFFPTMVTLWADPEGPDPAIVERELEIALPRSPSSAVFGDGLTAIWMGPEEWLIVAERLTPAELEGRLRTVLRDRRSAVVDVSAQRTIIRVSGDRARDVLAKGSSLDLHPLHFRSGHAAQTTVALSEALIVCVDSASADFRVIVRAAFATYLGQWLLDAGREYRRLERSK